MSPEDEFTRRQFLAAGATLAALGTPISGCVLVREPLRKRLIPGTDESLPVVGLGAPNFFYRTPPNGNGPAKALIQAMIKAGGRVIDTPPFFTPDPPVVGPILQELGVQDDLFLTAKITVRGKQAGIAHLERSVANLDKKPIDLLMVHNMLEMDNHWPTLKHWKNSGRARYIGVSLSRTTDYDGLERFMRKEQPDFIMIRYSIHYPYTGERILPLAVELGIAVIGIEAFKTDSDGNFFDLVGGNELPEWASQFDCESWAQFSLKYILSNPAVTCVVTETSKVKHIVDNMGGAYGRLPNDAMRKKMSDYLLSL